MNSFNNHPESHQSYFYSWRWLAPAFLAALLAACASAPASEPAPAAAPTVERVSKFGEYSGYSEERFDEWVTKSVYIPTRDGTRLAADISIPAVDGKVANERFPVLWTYTRYHRRGGKEPGINRRESTQHLVKSGYVVAVVQVRGGGASFGRYEGLFSAVETRDAYDVMEWLSTQDFSNGKLGMYGGSYLGITQYMAASTRHPALKAIMPAVSYLDFYDALRQGGILRSDLVNTWGKGTQFLDKTKVPQPVDEDVDGSLVAAAVKEHETNFDPIAPTKVAKFRDSTAPEFDWLSDTPSAVFDDIIASNIPIYHVGNWHDPYATSTMNMYADYPGTEKILMGPGAHGPQNAKEREASRIYNGTELLRWYDYWLKGIDNGIMDEAPIHAAVMDTPRESWEWVALDDFPGPEDRVDYYLTDTPANDSEELPDNFQLKTTQPEAAGAAEYAVNLETTSGTETRWDSNFGGGRADYPDMRANDSRSLIFTSAPLESDVVIAGAPIATLYLSASTPDTDIHILLEEVEANGKSNYVSEGKLRVSLRKESAPPWPNNLGLPWHRAYEEDQQFLTEGEVVELNIDMMPAAELFNRGNRIRFVIMGADKFNTENPPYPDAVWSVKVGADTVSKLSLPILAQ